jgi:hypothetical protein
LGRPKQVGLRFGEPPDWKLGGGVAARDRAHDATAGWRGFSHPYALKSGHLPAMYCSDASRTTSATKRHFVVGAEADSRILTSEEIRRFAPKFVKTLGSILGIQGDRAFDIISRCAVYARRPPFTAPQGISNATKEPGAHLK